MPPKVWLRIAGYWSMGPGCQRPLAAEKAGIRHFGRWPQALYPRPHFFISAPCAPEPSTKTAAPQPKHRGKPGKSQSGPAGSRPAKGRRGETWLYGLHAVPGRPGQSPPQAGPGRPDPPGRRDLGTKLLTRVRVETADPTPSTGCCPPGAVHQGAALEACAAQSPRPG